jgi:hypothetical protein
MSTPAQSSEHGSDGEQVPCSLAFSAVVLGHTLDSWQERALASSPASTMALGVPFWHRRASESIRFCKDFRDGAECLSQCHSCLLAVKDPQTHIIALTPTFTQTNWKFPLSKDMEPDLLPAEFYFRVLSVSVLIGCFQQPFSAT